MCPHSHSLCSMEPLTTCAGLWCAVLASPWPACAGCPGDCFVLTAEADRALHGPAQPFLLQHAAAGHLCRLVLTCFAACIML
jgi:hypothetical protein